MKKRLVSVLSWLLQRAHAPLPLLWTNWGLAAGQGDWSSQLRPPSRMSSYCVSARSWSLRSASLQKCPVHHPVTAERDRTGTSVLPRSAKDVRSQ